MNAIVVLNLRNYLPEAVRASFMDACSRWECKFVEITKPFGRMHHFWQKSLIPLSQYTKPFDRVLQLDGDMLIRSDCPNIFSLVPADNIGVVSRIQPRSGRVTADSPSTPWERDQAVKMGLSAYTKQVHHLNCGLVLYSPPRHRALLLEWEQTGRRLNWRRYRAPEQFALSCLLQSTAAPVTWLPWQYNTTAAGRIHYAPAGVMQTFVYHFCGPKRGGLANIVNRCQWRV